MDQYYTRNGILTSSCNSIFKAMKRFSTKVNIVDFSAGDGRLGSLLLEKGFPKSQLFEYDIQPKHNRIKPMNWFDVKHISVSSPETILVFNPPFGKGAHTACRFLEHALQLDCIRIVAAFLILPVYPITFVNIESHNVKLLPSNSFFHTNENDLYSAPATYHEVFTRPGAFLDFRLYTSFSNKPYHYPISELLPYSAQDTRYKKFTEVKHMLPFALIRKTGHYAGLTAIVIDKKEATLYYVNDSQIVKEQKVFDANQPPESRPWVAGTNRWRLTSFMDDTNGTGNRIGCAALKIMPCSETSLLNSKQLHADINSFLKFMVSNKDAIRGGGKGPKSIGIGTFNWIMAFGKLA